MKPRSLLLVASVLCFAAASGAGEVGEEPRVILEGQVFDTSGSPVPGVPVRVLMSRRVLALTDFSLRDEFAEGPATRTGATGFFRLELTAHPDYDFYYLRFYDTTTFDAVRFALPRDEDITDRVRDRRDVIVQRQLDDAPHWPAVRREVQRVGGVDSPRGRILRTLGLPDDVVRLPDGRSEWRYERAGVRYILRDGEVLERVALEAAVPGPVNR